MWNKLEDMIEATMRSMRPREKLTISQWAAKYRYVDNPGSFVGWWDNDKAPYLVEYADALASRDHTGVIFAGPARTGKSDTVFNWIGHSADMDPADMCVYLMTNSVSGEWSKRDLDKVLRAKPPEAKFPLLGSLVRPGKKNRTVHDVKFMSGMQLLIRWPAISELSGKTVPRIALCDYDRFDQDIDKQGAPFDLARKRTTTYKRFAMTLAESSPGFEVTDPKWIAATNHEAPPTIGILDLYNRGDRRRWYWRCLSPECRESFEPDYDLLKYSEDGDIFERAETVVLVCPCCGFEHTPDMKGELNRNGKWLKDGEHWNADGTVTGKARRSDIASFWLKGPAAAFQDWKGLVASYLQAMETYENTGDLGPLKKWANTDIGIPFEPPRNEMARLPEELKGRAEDWGSLQAAPSVPPWVRFLVATVDVQARAFVVQITGVGEGNDLTWIDGFKITRSDRVDPNDRRQEHAMLDPASFAEDWDLLIEQVIERTYPLSDKSGRTMAIKIGGIDSGGREGVTANAYAFWRRLRDDPLGRGHHRRFHLVKGEPSRSAPRRSTTYPDSNRRDRNAGARGDVPVQLLNSNLLKDQLSAMLGRNEPGGGMIRYAEWAPNWVYTQLTAEERTSKGWENKSQRRNETWDLTYYVIGLCLHPDISLERFKWDNPERIPAWAQPWDKNALVISPAVANPVAAPPQREDLDASKIAAEFM